MSLIFKMYLCLVVLFCLSVNFRPHIHLFEFCVRKCFDVSLILPVWIAEQMMMMVLFFFSFLFFRKQKKKRKKNFFFEKLSKIIYHEFRLAYLFQCGMRKFFSLTCFRVCLDNFMILQMFKFLM